MRQFKWIDWNLEKIGNHGLSADDIEAAFDRTESLEERSDGSFEMMACTPAGRRIRVVWRFDRDLDEIPDILGDVPAPPVFVITAY
jgi:hypothetical protein